MLIRNMSLDLWGTVLKSNPKFRLERAFFIQSKYKLNSSLDDIDLTFKKTANLFNNIESKGGKFHSTMEKLNAAYVNLGLTAYDKNDTKVLDNIFLDNLPYTYDSSTIETIQRLKRRILTLSTISNTGYADGYLMREALKRLHLDKYFDYMIFSDEIGTCKPNREVFDQWASLVSTKDVVDPRCFLHVGDDRDCDYEGPKKLGMDSFLINGKTGRSIKSVITFLDGKL